jgi:hypothetical protein
MGGGEAQPIISSKTGGTPHSYPHPFTYPPTFTFLTGHAQTRNNNAAQPANPPAKKNAVAAL